MVELAATVGAAVRVVRLASGRDEYALPMAAVRQIVRRDAGRWPADVPAVSLAELLGRPAGGGQVVLVRTAAGPVGLIADRVTQAAPVAAEDVFPCPPLVVAWTGGRVSAVVRLDDAMVPLLDPERLRQFDSVADADPPRDRRFGTAAPASEPGLTGQPRLGSRGHENETSPGRVLLLRCSDAAAGERPVSFAFALRHVREVVTPGRVVPLPGADGWLAGLAEWRGRPLPVVDLGRRLGFAPFPADVPPRLVVVGVPGSRAVVGLLARPHVEVLPLPLPHAASARELPAAAGLVRGAVERRADTVIVPDLGRLFRGD